MARPHKFERSQVLQTAMDVFWERGYCATSMQRILAETGLKPGSLYASFDSKETLFLAALDLYARRSLERVAAALADQASPLAAIEAYFRGLAADMDRATGRRSCLLVNTALEQARLEPRIRRRVNRHLDAIEGEFRAALQRAVDSGELPPGKDPAALAAFLMSAIWGLRVLGATGRQAGTRAPAIVEQLLGALHA